MGKAMKIGIVGSAIILCVYLGLSYYVQKTFRLRISIPEITEKGHVIGDEAKKLASEAQDGTIPWRQLDHTTGGFPRREAKLLEMRRAVDFFQISYGQSPTDSKDISRLATIPGVSSKDKDMFKRIADECSMVRLEKDAYILDCDGWTPSNSEEVHKYTQSYDRKTEKFYIIQNHVILFVPAPVTSTPTGGQS